MSDSDVECYSEAEYIRQHVEMADKSLSEHVIVRHDVWEAGGLVIVGKPNGSSCYRCEIVLVPSGHLILTGDLDTMVWGRFGGGAVREAIHWMARSDVSYYVKQKANIGMGSIGCEEFELPVAIWEAREYLRDAQRDECSSAEKWKKIIAKLESEDEEWTHASVTEMLYDTLCDFEYPNLGMVPSQRLLWAWSVLRKTSALLSGPMAPEPEERVCRGNSFWGISRRIARNSWDHECLNPCATMAGCYGQTCWLERFGASCRGTWRMSMTWGTSILPKP